METIINMLPVFIVGGIVVGIVISREQAQEKRRADRLAKWGRAGPPPSLHCLTCGSDHAEDEEAPPRGNTGIEVALWILMLPFGIVYSVWRRNKTAGKRGCPACHSTAVVPITSPAARAHIKQLEG